jgi:hypothetical protein
VITGTEDLHDLGIRGRIPPSASNESTFCCVHNLRPEFLHQRISTSSQTRQAKQRSRRGLSLEAEGHLRFPAVGHSRFPTLETGGQPHKQAETGRASACPVSLRRDGHARAPFRRRVRAEDGFSSGLMSTRDLRVMCLEVFLAVPTVRDQKCPDPAPCCFPAGIDARKLTRFLPVRVQT